MTSLRLSTSILALTPSTHTTTASIGAQHQIRHTNTTQPVVNRWHINVGECIINTQDRKLRHVQGISLRNCLIAEIYDDEEKEEMGKVREYDAFFSLHLDDLDNTPIYVSEITSDILLNADWQQFQLREIYLQSTLILKIWIRRADEDWKLLQQHQIKLHNLLYMNSSLDDVRIPLDLDTPLTFIHLTDGVYLIPPTQQFIDDYERLILHLLESESSYNGGGSRGGGKVPSLTYNYLAKLVSLERYTGELMAKKGEIEKSINQEMKDYEVRWNGLNNSRNELKQAVEKVKSEIQVLKERHADMGEDQDQNRKQTKVDDDDDDEYQTIRDQTCALNESKTAIMTQIQALKRQHIKTLLQIHNLSPEYTTASSNVLPSINKYQLLSKQQILATDKDLINYTLGTLTHLTLVLSRVLLIPLRYIPHYNNSTSFITDPLNSQLRQSSTFPLFVSGEVERGGGVVAYKRWRYGVGLLCANWEIIRGELEN